MSSHLTDTEAETVELTIDMVPDVPTVTPTGERIETLIEGVQVRRSITHTDTRGSLTEMYDPRWGLTDEPLVYVYTASIRPGGVKGWIVHRRGHDRLWFGWGEAKVVLFDARVGSPTEGMVNELFFDASSKGLLRIPIGVVHAVQNLGSTELHYVNMPTRPYEHDAPDKSRLPLDTDLVPYRF